MIASQNQDRANMKPTINFYEIFTLLKEWFDAPTPRYDDFDRYRLRLYDEYSSGSRPPLVGSVGPNPTSHDRPLLPLKIWWPHYTDGDFRFELCIGALLVHQTSWRQVEKAVKAILGHLIVSGKQFNAEGIAAIPLAELESLIRPTGFYRQKARRVQGFCKHVFDNYRTISRFMEWGREVGKERFGVYFRGLGMGFGKETRDSVLLYAANVPVFIADSYARKLLLLLGDQAPMEYEGIQRRYMDGIERDFPLDFYDHLVEDYTQEELAYALPNSPPKDDIPKILLYQQFHAGIDELGISKRWEEFIEELLHRSKG